MNNNPNDYVTWVYSDEGDNKGWYGRLTFNPEDMCRVNSKFFSFKMVKSTNTINQQEEIHFME
jgi:hypothetical protein